MFGIRGISFVMLSEIHKYRCSIVPDGFGLCFRIVGFHVGCVFIAVRDQRTTVDVVCGMLSVVGSPNGYNNCMVISEYA